VRGIRFDRRVAGPIGPLIAPPYDVAAVDRNAVELSISGIENADLGHAGEQHLIAAQRYQEWLAAGILRRDATPAFYVHQHQFLIDGEEISRTGLIARVRLHDWSDRVVLPHEGTFPGPRLERLGRLRAVGANLSPLYFLYRDPAGAIRGLIAEHIRRSELAAERDRMGGSHRLEPLTDPRLLGRLTELFKERSLFVADGHHRYEAALAFRDEQRRHHPGKNGAWEYVLALLAAVEDPGVRVYPTHRILAGGAAIDPGFILQVIARWFDVAEERDCGPTAMEQAAFRLVIHGDSQSWIARFRPGHPHLALLRADRGPAWRSLAVTAVEGVLQSLTGLGADAPTRRIVPIVDRQAAIGEVRAGRAHAAFLLPTPSLDRLLAVAEEGDLLPPKSTWFDPKAPAGLVINDLALSAP
jgi:uncharacterized protein (DUF1015 family)